MTKREYERHRAKYERLEARQERELAEYERKRARDDRALCTLIERFERYAEADDREWVFKERHRKAKPLSPEAEARLKELTAARVAAEKKLDALISRMDRRR
jgi:hypothetical protein